MNSLFGVDLPTPVNFVIAFVVVLVLIGAATWMVRRFGASGLDASSRGRQPRLAVIDAAAVDGRRKLVIIRRDNVEHLLMIGGPTDVVVETNIVRAGSAVREAPAARTNGGADAPRSAPLPDPTPWPLQPEPVSAHPPPVHTPRTERSPRILTDDPMRWDAPIDSPPPAAPVRNSRPADTLAGFASELSRPTAELSGKPRVVAAESAPAAQAGNASQPAPAGDHNLAEMAQRLEAALRRPATSPRLATDGGGPPRAAPAPELKPAARDPKIAVMPSKSPAQPRPQPTPQQSANLEQEMANLLGRPGKT